MPSTRCTPLLFLLPCLLALPCCRGGEESGKTSHAGETGTHKLLKAPSSTDREFLEKMKKLPRTEVEQDAERWTNVGVTVESGWVVDRGPNKLVIEHTDISKEELGQHYIDKLEKKGWKESTYERDIGSFMYEFDRKKAELKVTGQDRKGGGAVVTIEILKEGKK
jgi:hypothetical protein